MNGITLNMNGSRVPSEALNRAWPICHFTPMTEKMADDGCQRVTYYECEHCGHTKELGRCLAG